MINVSLVGALDLASGAGLYANGAGVDGDTTLKFCEARRQAPRYKHTVRDEYLMRRGMRDALRRLVPCELTQAALHVLQVRGVLVVQGVSKPPSD